MNTLVKESKRGGLTDAGLMVRHVIADTLVYEEWYGMPQVFLLISDQGRVEVK